MTLQIATGCVHDKKKKHTLALPGLFFKEFCDRLSKREQ